MANKINVKLILELRDAHMSRNGIASTRHMSRTSVSDVFHNIIARYLTVDRRSHRETPLYESYFDNRFLPKNAKGEKKAFVINHKKQEAYDSASYQEGDIARELRECYYDQIEKKQAFDLQYLITQNDRIPGVQKVYELLSDTDNDISDENRRLASQITNYFASVAVIVAVSGFSM